MLRQNKYLGTFFTENHLRIGIMNRLKNFLKQQSQFFLATYLGLAGFSTYFCMYAFRKPFTAGNFHDLSLWGIDYKIVLVIAQVLGYATAKGWGIKLVSEVKPTRRAIYMVAMISFSCLNLLLFACVPPTYNWVFLYFNGLGLGMVYGLVFSYLEGRQITEILGAGLAVSFIVSSGIVKSIGKYFINQGINEYWMPFWTGLCFFPLLLLSVFALHLSPHPTNTDQAERTVRVPMNAQHRSDFLHKYGLGLILLITVYVLMTMLRDIRDNFGIEIWRELGVSDASIFTKTESLIGLIICGFTALMYFEKDHKRAFWLNHLLIFMGSALIFVATIGFLHQLLSPFWWSVLLGIGMYMAYVPFNGMLFDRLLAVVKENANVGFLFYLADFSGYLGSVFILLYQNFGTKNTSWLKLLTDISQLLPLFSMVLVAASFLYFSQKLNPKAKKSPTKIDSVGDGVIMMD
jgi:MFS family permease